CSRRGGGFHCPLERGARVARTSYYTGPDDPERQEIRALTVEAQLRRPELRAEFHLEPGQILFTHNRWILHNRTTFGDDPDPAAAATPSASGCPGTEARKFAPSTAEFN